MAQLKDIIEIEKQRDDISKCAKGRHKKTSVPSGSVEQMHLFFFFLC